VIRRSLAIAAVLSALAAAAPTAFAQSPGASPFSPLPPAQTPTQTQTQTTPAPVTQTSSDDSGPSVLGIAGLFGLGVLVICVIGWFILRDARRSLPKHARRQPRRARKKAKAQPVAAAAAGGRRPPPRPPRKAKSAQARRSKRRSRRRSR
jgi:hypothetical protein